MSKHPDDELPGQGGPGAAGEPGKHPDCGSDADASPSLPREIGGRPGPEPTRFGDWEKNGRCIDF